ncbi:transcriptional regulator [Desulfosporosinus orientis DSM 765]|uniref:Transcriptional regulator n=1 Tax=Desulfosporosinus orientis (strain ATCC 19365 / DSM 765 / NCIMB 8382 / VKM B-1628 / Singapore I) TaxID=768706 RepID=G7WD96_DESOD|nr:MarR family winged helix-turn-helix transcriptional regulator [Desulfosporosinus orientis]AET67581.1 transcriptional regulator [Desulfosporosinus orientis DSM 765]
MTNKEFNDSLKLYTALHRLGRQLHRCAHRVGRGDHYREQSRLLLLISENDGVIQRDLAEEMDVRPSSMTEMLAKIEQLGLIERRQDEKDQRVMHIYLTEQGKNAAMESQGATKAMTDVLFGGMSEEELSQMLTLSEKLSAHLNAVDTTGTGQGFAGRGHHRGFGKGHGYCAKHHGHDDDHNSHHRDYYGHGNDHHCGRRGF